MLASFAIVWRSPISQVRVNSNPASIHESVFAHQSFTRLWFARVATIMPEDEKSTLYIYEADVT